MKSSYLIVVALPVAFLCSSCVMTSSLIRYHHGNETGNAFWMTISSSPIVGYDRRVETSLWYCSAEKKNEPVCTQVKLRTCEPKTADCMIVSDQVSLDELASSKPAVVVAHDSSPVVEPAPAVTH